MLGIAIAILALPAGVVLTGLGAIMIAQNEFSATDRVNKIVRLMLIELGANAFIGLIALLS